WYSGGWDAALAGRADDTFQFHHQAFAFFRRYADGTEGRRLHLADETAFLSDLHAHRLPAASFIKPLGVDTEHPGYARLLAAQAPRTPPPPHPHAPRDGLHPPAHRAPLGARGARRARREGQRPDRGLRVRLTDGRTGGRPGRLGPVELAAHLALGEDRQEVGDP